MVGGAGKDEGGAEKGAPACAGAWADSMAATKRCMVGKRSSARFCSARRTVPANACGIIAIDGGGGGSSLMIEAMTASGSLPVHGGLPTKTSYAVTPQAN